MFRKIRYFIEDHEYLELAYQFCTGLVSSVFMAAVYLVLMISFIVFALTYFTV